jgi:opacity protein-like surface antigen
MKSVFIAAVIAAACSGVALAGEVKQEQKVIAPTVKAQVMSDSEMDKVTAGAGFGVDTAFVAVRLESVNYAVVLIA